MLYFSKSGCIYWRSKILMWFMGVRTHKSIPLSLLVSIGDSIKETLSKVKFRSCWQLKLALLVKCLPTRNRLWFLNLGFWSLMKSIFAANSLSAVILNNFWFLSKDCFLFFGFFAIDIVVIYSWQILLISYLYRIKVSYLWKYWYLNVGKLLCFF